MKATTFPNPKFSDLQLLGRLRGLSWLSTTQLKSIDDAMSAMIVKT
jgi:hypothetical protein